MFRSIFRSPGSKRVVCLVLWITGAAPPKIPPPPDNTLSGACVSVAFSPRHLVIRHYIWATAGAVPCFARSALPPYRNVDGHARPEIHLHSRRPRTQSEEHRPRSAARFAGGDDRAVGVRQVVARLRYDLRRGPAPLCREPVGLCPAVP